MGPGRRSCPGSGNALGSRAPAAFLALDPGGVVQDARLVPGRLEQVPSPAILGPRGPGAARVLLGWAAVGLARRRLGAAGRATGNAPGWPDAPSGPRRS